MGEDPYGILKVTSHGRCTANTQDKYGDMVSTRYNFFFVFHEMFRCVIVMNTSPPARFWGGGG